MSSKRKQPRMEKMKKTRKRRAAMFMSWGKVRMVTWMSFLSSSNFLMSLNSLVTLSTLKILPN